jgi:hypothetical protein
MPVDPVRASGFTVVEVGAGAVRLEKDGRSFGVFVNRASAEMVAKLLLNQGTST